MNEKIIKSKQRVQKHGEVFTPSWMVQKMLDTPGIMASNFDFFKSRLRYSRTFFNC